MDRNHDINWREAYWRGYKELGRVEKRYRHMKASHSITFHNRASHFTVVQNSVSKPELNLALAPILVGNVVRFHWVKRVNHTEED